MAISPASSASAAPTAGITGSWPAYAMVLIVLAAAAYAFSPRPLPPFKPTQIYPDRLLITGLASSGARVVAVGELGHILVGDAGGTWREAHVEPQRGSTLTNLAFIDARTAIAVGHDGWILRSEDGGENWKEVSFDTEHPDPLMGVAGPFGGKLFAFGAFGRFMTSTDQGKTWSRQTLNIVDEKKQQAAVDENADPFANFEGGGGSLSDRHLNAMSRLDDGSLLLVGEQGLMLRSRDDGASWKPLPQVYAGSWYGVLTLPDNGVLVFGMRGNAYLSRDNGGTWKKSEVPLNASLFGGTRTREGEIVLVGDNNTVLISKDGGAHFKLAYQAEHRGLAAGLAAVLPVAGGLLTGGDGGIVLQKLGAAGGKS